MNDLLRAFATELKNPATTHVAAASAGAIAVAVLHRLKMDNGRVFELSQAAFDALVNDETNYVRFATTKHPHVFRITLEQ